MDLMGISETKMKIVIDNYFKSECNVDTSIRQAFEKGFRIGVQKVITLQPERKKGKWISVKGSNGKDYHKCSECLHTQDITGVKNYCSVCGAEMMGVQDE